MLNILYVFIIFLFFSTTCVNIYGQELIINGSFEMNLRCPEGVNDLDACIGWTQSSANRSSDYFCSCALYGDAKSVNVPDNTFGYQYPNSGNCYVGLSLSDVEKNYREYIQTKLVKKLVANEKYRLSFYVSLADSSENYCPLINACFSNEYILPEIRAKNKYEHLSCGANNLILQFNLPVDTSIIMNWIKVENEFIATGQEVYLTIGLFEKGLTNKKAKKVLNQHFIQTSRRALGSYIYIDDVSLIKVIDN